MTRWRGMMAQWRDFTIEVAPLQRTRWSEYHPDIIHSITPPAKLNGTMYASLSSYVCARGVVVRS